MNIKRAYLIFLTLLMYWSPIVANPFVFKKNREVTLPIEKYNNILYSIPEPPKFKPTSLNFFGLEIKEIYPIPDELRQIEFSDFPEEYDIWSDHKINPYNVRLVDTKDTILLDLRNYYPPSTKYITSDFGFRRARHHYGIDLKVHRGDSVYNAFDGVVRITRRARDYGFFVVVRHNNGLETLYAHLNKILVKPGDTISAGHVVGMGGNTGRSTGYHLHFEVRFLGNPINPHDIIDFNNHKPKNEIYQLTSANFDYIKEVEKIRYWTVRRGDTLGRISQRTGVSIARLCSLNGIKRNSILRIGQRIRYT